MAQQSNQNITSMSDIDPRTQQDKFQVTFMIGGTEYHINCEYDLGSVTITATDIQKHSYKFEKDAKEVKNMFKDILNLDSFSFYSIIKKAFINYELGRKATMCKHSITGELSQTLTFTNVLSFDATWHVEVVDGIIMENHFRFQLDQIERSDTERMGLMLEDFTSEKQSLKNKIEELEVRLERMTDAIQTIYSGVIKFSNLPPITLV